MRIVFELTMPNVNSWNGKWTGANNKYTISYKPCKTDLKNLPHLKKILEKLKQGENSNFFYDFGDGWGANVEVRIAKPRERVTNKFCGYEWMIKSIIEHGMIKYIKW